jgi:ATP-dependent Lon protease
MDTNERLKEARKTIGERKTERLENKNTERLEKENTERLEKENTERLENKNTERLENKNTERLEDLVIRGHIDLFSFLACSYHLYWLIAL